MIVKRSSSADRRLSCSSAAGFVLASLASVRGKHVEVVVCEHVLQSRELLRDELDLRQL